MSILRQGILDGRTALLAGADPALAAALEQLGARTVPWDVGAPGVRPVPGDVPEQPGARAMADDTPPGEAERPVGAWAAAHGPVHALVLDSRRGFATGGRAALNDLLQHDWALVRECATAMIRTGEGGKLVLIAPAQGAGPLAGAARAALENMARTLSIEWARYAITICAVLPGPATTEPELAELTAYLLSPGGDYFTGCRFELR